SRSCVCLRVIASLYFSAFSLLFSFFRAHSLSDVKASSTHTHTHTHSDVQASNTHTHTHSLRRTGIKHTHTHTDTHTHTLSDVQASSTHMRKSHRPCGSRWVQEACDV